MNRREKRSKESFEAKSERAKERKSGFVLTPRFGSKARADRRAGR
jgi:hypothetical protein